MVAGWALATTIPGSFKPIIEILKPRLGVRLRRGYIGYMTHSKRDYKGSFAALWPPQGGPADLKVWGWVDPWTQPGAAETN